MLEKYIELLRPEVEKIFAGDSSGHDIGHLERVKNLGIYLQGKEGGNLLVIGVAGFLHDIHRVIKTDSGKYCSPEESLPIVEQLLIKIKFPNELIPEVLNAIKYHENYNWNKDIPNAKEIEALILQDADNLDAIGAIGIARLFAYGGSHKLPMFNNAQINENSDYKEETGNSESSIQHMHHKLIKLGDYMNTKTARNISKERTDYMKEFTRRFVNEWNSKI